MLKDSKIVANIPVKDLKAASRFYGETLGLQEIGREGEEVITYRSGGSDVFVYRSEFAGTNKATAMTWQVGNEVEGVVRELKGKGIRFEHYEMPELEHRGDLHVGGGMKVAWFKDPDGNILSVVGE